MTENQNLPRACDKSLDSSFDFPLEKNAQETKLDSNVSCSNNLMQWPDSTGPKKEALTRAVTFKIFEVPTILLLSELQSKHRLIKSMLFTSS